MVGLMVKCISTKPYLYKQSDGSLIEGEFDGNLISLTLNKVYSVIGEEYDYFRIVDDTDEDYLYPKTMFEICSKVKNN